jgi:uncharacterized membrane protein YhhN
LPIRRSTPVLILLAAGVALAVFGALLTMHLGRSGLSRILLMLGSTGFLAIALIRGGVRHPYGRLITAGLFFCWLGDFLGPVNFDVGVAAFLVAHLAFIRAFWRHGLNRSRILPCLAGVAVVSALILSWLLPYVLSSSRGLVVGYTAAISLMLGLAVATRPGPARRWIVSAAPIFYVSDLIVARWAFVGGGTSNAYFCYPLYYAACVLFAVSIQPAQTVSSGAGQAAVKASNGA